MSHSENRRHAMQQTGKRRAIEAYKRGHEARRLNIEKRKRFQIIGAEKAACKESWWTAKGSRSEWYETAASQEERMSLAPKLPD